MQYKTIALGLLEDQPELYRQLQMSRQLLPMLEQYATELQASHEAWAQRMTQTHPQSDSRQIAAEALELAIESLRNRLHSGSQTEEVEPLSLDAAMAYLKRHTPPA